MIYIINIEVENKKRYYKYNKVHTMSKILRSIKKSKSVELNKLNITSTSRYFVVLDFRLIYTYIPLSKCNVIVNKIHTRVNTLCLEKKKYTLILKYYT